MLVVHIALDMKVAVHADGPIIAKFQEAATLMYKPELATWRRRRHLVIGEATSDDDTLFYVAFLGNQKHLITGVGWAGHSPSAADPLRQHG